MRPETRNIPYWIYASFVAVLGLLAIEALVAVPLLSWVSFSGEERPGLASLPVLLVVFVGLYVGYRAGMVERVRRSWVRVADHIPSLFILIGCGIVLRVLWWSLFPVQPQSDAATYIELAKMLLDGDEYSIDGTLAYWPVGYPLILSAIMHIPFGTSVHILVLNIVMYVLLSIAVYSLASRIAHARGALLSVALVTFWPSLFMASGVAAKELVLMSLLALAFSMIMTEHPPSFIRIIAAGVLLGLSVLVQPSTLLAPFIYPIYAKMQKWSLLTTATITAILIATIVLCLTPWAYRNYEMLGRFVPVSTNGGSNFYRANNPLASGGYTPRGAADLSHLGELERNAEGYKLGLKWISQNVGDFLLLSVWKQIRFMGDDSYGAYETMSRGNTGSKKMYYAMKGFSNIFWLYIWLSILALLKRVRTIYLNPVVLASLLVFLYFWAIHSVFESDGKYHLPGIPFLVIVFTHLVLGGKISNNSTKTSLSRP